MKPLNITIHEAKAKYKHDTNIASVTHISRWKMINENLHTQQQNQNKKENKPLKTEKRAAARTNIASK